MRISDWSSDVCSSDLDLAVAAAEGWTDRARPMFEMPPHVHLDDPLGRLLGHIDFRLAMLDGPTEDYTCFVGTMVQEAYATSDRIRAARSEERRVGKECGSTCRSGGSAYH